MSDVMCACGAPVTMLSPDKYLYCGRKECLEHIKEDEREAKYIPTARDWSKPSKDPWPGYGERASE